MTEQQYRDWIGQQVFWQHGQSTLVGTAVRYDEDDREVFLHVDGLMHAHVWAPVHECRIERPVPTTAVWRDKHGDEWVEDAGGLMHSFETAPFPREHVEKKWGPLVPVGSQPSVPTREQIAEAIDTWWEATYPRAVMLEEVEQLKDAVLALLNGADRG